MPPVNASESATFTSSGLCAFYRCRSFWWQQCVLKAEKSPTNPGHAKSTDMKRGVLIGLFGLLNPVLASEMPEDLEAYLKSKGADREERSLEEWLALYGEEMPPELPAPSNSSRTS